MSANSLFFVIYIYYRYDISVIDLTRLTKGGVWVERCSSLTLLRPVDLVHIPGKAPRNNDYFFFTLLGSFRYYVPPRLPLHNYLQGFFFFGWAGLEPLLRCSKIFCIFMVTRDPLTCLFLTRASNYVHYFSGFNIPNAQSWRIVKANE